MGVDHRAIKIGGEISYIFGVIDLCVSENYKNKGIGTNLLRTLGGLALKSNVDFIILMADNEEIYIKNGFHHVSNGLTTWLAIEDVKSHSLITRNLSHCFMYKSVNLKQWPGGEIDMLGYLF
jgi:N-acetylglutamate synthase-like GNAT family acetyltransferase